MIRAASPPVNAVPTLTPAPLSPYSSGGSTAFAKEQMSPDQFRRHCLGKKGVTEEFPFGVPVAVYKVQGKMFALADADFRRINLKCDPVRAIALRERYRGVIPGYHMNKRHWNSVIMDGSVDDALVYEWVDHSYDLVVAGLTNAQREALRES